MWILGRNGSGSTDGSVCMQSLHWLWQLVLLEGRSEPKHLIDAPRQLLQESGAGPHPGPLCPRSFPLVSRPP